LDSEWLLSVLFDVSRFPTQSRREAAFLLGGEASIHAALTLSKSKLAR
jgi:hypothetical protein